MLHFMRKLVAQAASKNIDIFGGTGFLLMSGYSSYFYFFEYIPLDREYGRLQKTFEKMSEVQRMRDHPPVVSAIPCISGPYDSLTEV